MIDCAISLRRASLKDLDEVFANETAAYAFNWSRQALEGSLNEQYLFFIIELKEQNIGHLILHPILEECHLLNLCVHPKFQNCGLGKQAMRFWFELATELDFRELLLEVRESNEKAIGLYRYFGFEQIGLRKGYYPASEQSRENGVVMQKRLDSPMN